MGLVPSMQRSQIESQRSISSFLARSCAARSLFHHLFLFCRHRHWAGNKRPPPRRSSSSSSSSSRKRQQQQQKSPSRRGLKDANKQEQADAKSESEAVSAATKRRPTPISICQLEKQDIDEACMLQFLRRSRSILASNRRCHLATVNAAASESGSRVHASFVRYALLEGVPCIWLDQKDERHDLNVLMDDRVSLVLGHTDPLPLIHALKMVGCVPPHLLLFGHVDPVAELDVATLKRSLKEISSCVKSASDGASSALQPILKDSGRCMGAWPEMHAEAIDPRNVFSWYRVVGKSCYFVDSTGARHKLKFPQLIGTTEEASLDGLSPLLVAIIEGINQSKQRRLSLMALCAIHHRVRAEDAVMVSADRWGFHVLAKVSGNSSDVQTSQDSFAKAHWKELRFDLHHEVWDADSFCYLLSELEAETLRFLK